ncbi:MAG TPA: flavin prenyltransferase UbiX [Candidatus Krumholzibacteria bacterium]|jgi:4-hydroxy-3-polyprenylbenzoate decarboxylase|nr:flavin prenyltransferase UbiX [Candidatus Krumholzibacteria bacterium]
MMAVYAVGITGGSGAPYALRLLRVLLDKGHDVHLVISPAGETILQVESGIRVGKTLREKAATIATAIETQHEARLRVFDPMNLAAPISSGSFACEGMVIVPCSTGTLGRIANGISSNLIERAADVCLKERRRLVVVPRETPLNEIHLRNMLALRQAGADILPAMPAFYHKPRHISDLIDMIVGRVLDRLGVENELFQRWGGDAPAED